MLVKKQQASGLFLRLLCRNDLSEVKDVEVRLYAGVGADGVVHLRTVVLPDVAGAVGISEKFLAFGPVVFHCDE